MNPANGQAKTNNNGSIIRLRHISFVDSMSSVFDALFCRMSLYFQTHKETSNGNTANAGAQHKPMATEPHIGFEKLTKSSQMLLV